MRAIATLIATAFLLSGCSSLPGNEETDIEAAALPEFPFTVTLGNGTLSAGMPFMVELNSTLDSNLTANATWTYQVHEATYPAQENATAANATMEGNSTENATAMPPVLVLEGNGTGLPAMVNLTLEGGNFTITSTANLTGYNATMAVVDVVVALDEVVDEVEELTEAVEGDLCAGVSLAPVPISGSFDVAVAGRGFFSSNPFKVPACVTSMHAVVTGDTLMIDMMLRLRDGDDKDLATSDSRSDSTEELTFSPANGIPAGSYNLNVRGQLAGPSQYEGTITFS